MKIPKRLRRTPLVDAVAEVRFTAAIPADAILGIVYAAVKDPFGEPVSLPILQMPLALRESDENLKYQSCYRFTKPGNVLLVGPHNVALSTIPYTTWSATTPLLSDLLTRLDRLKLFHAVERVSLRYINFFENLNILAHSTLALDINSESIANQNIHLRSEADAEGFQIITSIANTVEVVVSGQSKKGSLLDLDIVKNKPDIKGTNVPGTILEILTHANALADKAFFRLLKEDFIAQLEPEY